MSDVSALREQDRLRVENERLRSAGLALRRKIVDHLRGHADVRAYAALRDAIGAFDDALAALDTTARSALSGGGPTYQEMSVAALDTTIQCFARAIAGSDYHDGPTLLRNADRDDYASRVGSSLRYLCDALLLAAKNGVTSTKGDG